MKNYNALERLSNIFTLISTPQEDATPENLSNALEIPVSVIEDDIDALFRNETFSNNRLEEDDTSISIDANGFNFTYDTVPIYTSHKEKVLLTKYFPDFVENNAKVQYQIKESPYISSNNLSELCDKIQLAIDNKYYVKFTYRSRNKKKLLSFEIEPHLLYHNINNGRMYLISITDRIYTFRLDLILALTELPKQKCHTDIPLEKLELFDYLWGMDISSTDEPCHVKVRIDVFNHNMLQKIKSDISRRKHAKIYQDGECWYYEDDIIGLSAFKTWIYQFGYSVTVLSPEPLAKEIYESALQRLENYRENCFIFQ